MSSRILLVLLVVGASGALAEDAKAKAAREELEKQLSQMVGTQPTKVRIDYVALDDPNYRLEEATFQLDGRSLGTPSLGQLSEEGTHLVWNGDVTPGKHTVRARIVFSNGASVVLSDEGGNKWTVAGDVSFDVNAGIEVRVQATPTRDSKQTDVAKRFKLSLPAQPVMIAQLDDGKMPEAMAKPVSSTPDAGLSAEALAADTKQQAATALAAKQAAADEKQRKAEAALAAKQAAADEKKLKAEAALAAKQAAADEKKQRAADAKAAKQAAADEKKQRAADALEAKRLAALDASERAEEKLRLASEQAQMLERAKNLATPLDAPAPTVDAGAAVAVAPPVVDAGAEPVALAPPLVDAGTPLAAAAPPPPEDRGPPGALIAGAGGLAALLFLVVVARRRSRPPTLDD